MSDENETEELEPVGSSELLGFFKVRPARNGLIGFVAWGALERLTADDAVTEPAEPVHFNFGKTEDEAVSKLTAEMENEYGISKWERQEA